jgi:hypothetical protein
MRTSKGVCIVKKVETGCAALLSVVSLYVVSDILPHCVSTCNILIYFCTGAVSGGVPTVVSEKATYFLYILVSRKVSQKLFARRNFAVFCPARPERHKKQNGMFPLKTP